MPNLAIAGLGWWGQTLVDAVQGLSEAVRFTVAVVRRPEPVAAYAARRGLTLSTDLAATLADPEVHGIVLATPDSQHAGQVIAAAKARKAVLVEKPFTLDRASAEQAVAACRAAGTVLAFAHNRRFLPALREIKRRLETGAIGTPLHIEGNFSSNFGLRYQPGMWRASRTESVAGGMTGLGIHQIDAMIYLCGRFRRVTARSVRQAVSVDVEDTTSMLFDFASGMTGAFTTLIATPPMWRLRLLGTKGWAEMLGEDRLLVSEGTGLLQEIFFPATRTERLELEAFAAAIEGRAPYPISAEDAIHGVAVLDAVIRSATTQSPADVAGERPPALAPGG